MKTLGLFPFFFFITIKRVTWSSAGHSSEWMLLPSCVSCALFSTRTIVTTPRIDSFSPASLMQLDYNARLGHGSHSRFEGALVSSDRMKKIAAAVTVYLIFSPFMEAPHCFLERSTSRRMIGFPAAGKAEQRRLSIADEETMNQSSLW